MALLIRLIITIFFFIALALTTDLSIALNKVLSLSPEVLVTCFFLLLSQLIITGIRWHVLIKTMSGSLPLKNCIKLYWIGMFFSQMLPTSIGGDVVRVILIDEKYFSRKKAFASIILERFIGLGILVIGALFYLMPLLAEVEIPSHTIYIFTTCCIFGVLMFKILENNAIFIELRKFIVLIIFECTNGLLILIKSPGVLFKFLILSIMSHSLLITAAYLLITDLNGIVAIFPIIGTMACVMVLAALPLSINGWGVREGAMLLLLTQVGVSAEAAIASGISLGVITLLFSLPGGILYIQK